PKLKTLYFIWRNPYMIAGGDTFISEMMNQAGFENAATHLTRYPSVSAEEIKNLNSEILILSSEPFPFKQKHIDEMQKIFPATKIILADGELFSWYGCRMKLAPDYFRSLRQQVALSF
ncbi:MAG: helical backbone metal receptor, partial [Chlamydiota bacterium]